MVRHRRWPSRILPSSEERNVVMKKKKNIVVVVVVCSLRTIITVFFPSAFLALIIIHY